MTKRTSRLAMAVASAALASLGCQNEGRSDLSGQAPAASVELRAARMDDATKTISVLRQIHAANQTEIEMGKLAMDRAQNAEVKKFAGLMVSDHTSVDQKLTDLAKRANLDLDAPAATPVEGALAGTSDGMKRMLRGFTGPQFDVAYTAPQVQMHEFALELINQGQKTAAGDTKKFLDETRPGIEAHLDHAKSLMRGLTFAPIGVGGGPLGGEAPPSSSAPGSKGTDIGAGGRHMQHGGGGTKPNP